MPPLNSWQIIPVPPPTLPSATAPPAAAPIAASTWNGFTWNPFMSLSAPSYVSPTTGRDQKTDSFPRLRAAWATSASRTTPTLWVFVMPMTPPSIPDSRTHSSPVSSPLPLRRWQPAKTGSVQTSSECGTTTVTPVRTGPWPTTRGPSPGMSVVWPTATPGTSVMASCSPAPSSPMRRPSSLARMCASWSGTRPPFSRHPYDRAVPPIPEARPAAGHPSGSPGLDAVHRAPPRLLRLDALDGVAPMDAAEAFRDLPGLALLESARPGRTGRWSYLAADPVAVLDAPAEGPDPFAEARALLGRLDGGTASTGRHATAR